MALPSILDTDILSEYLKGHGADVAEGAARYAEEHGVFTFTSVTVFEIVFGLAFKGAASQLSKVCGSTKTKRLRRRRRTYRRAATIKAVAARQGAIVELPDCLIAVTPRGWGAPSAHEPSSL